MKSVKIIYRSNDTEKAEFDEFKDAAEYAETKPGTVEFFQIVQFEEVAE